MELTPLSTAAVCDSASMSADIAEGIAWGRRHVVMELSIRSLASAPRDPREYKEEKEEGEEEEKGEERGRRSNQGNDVGEGGGHPQTRNQFRHETSRCPERLLVSSKFLKPLLHPPHPPAPRTRVVGSSRLSGSRLSWAQHRQSPVRARQLRKCWSGQA